MHHVSSLLPPSAGSTSASPPPMLHPQRTSDLARGPQAPCSSTRSRAAALRPRVMPPGASGFRPPGRNPRTKRPQPHRHRNPHLAARLRVPRRVGPRPRARSEVSPRALRASVSRRGRRRSQGAMTDPSWFDEPPPNQQAQRPLAHRQSFTHSGPLTSHGAFRPRAAAREAVLRTSDLA